MENNKWLYFVQETDEANLVNPTDAVCLPAKNLVSISPTANNRVTLYFDPVYSSFPNSAKDSVVLETIVGDAFEVANEIAKYISARNTGVPFIVVANDLTTADPGDATLTPHYIHPSITGVNAINVSTTSWQGGAGDYHFSLHSGTVPNVGVADGAFFEVNTHYAMDVNSLGARAIRIPPSIESRAGDWISVLFTSDLGNEVVYTFTADDTNYQIGSTLFVPPADARTAVVVSSNSDDRIVKITGATNGDGGRGTTIQFRNMTGEANGWAVQAVVQGQGNLSVASSNTTIL
tara:strand:+ start:118 stop:990 length:873 start_codon:yes stop_codon:yes gene_type:complete